MMSVCCVGFMLVLVLLSIGVDCCLCVKDAGDDVEEEANDADNEDEDEADDVIVDASDVVNDDTDGAQGETVQFIKGSVT